ncbi:hypothetical protein ACQEVZ_39825 [Dactylosporangium sp. CA-152071]|uniref:hypothetical protein n=1 Tax=Dactylosporangium sp. CA-152071 TaxID=3239933 RepID=UPI003D8B6166
MWAAEPGDDRLDGDVVLELLLDALPPISGDERDVVTLAVRETRDTDAPWTAGGIARSALISRWAEEWAQRLGQPVNVVADVLEHRFAWLSPSAVEAAAAVIGEGVDPAEVWRFAVRVERVPDHLDRVASGWDVTPAELFRLAVIFDTDPRHLTPVLRVYDQHRPLMDHIAEWVAWFDRWTDVRRDRGLLMTAMHDTGMTVEWEGTTEQLRDIVDTWIATTLGQDLNALRELERAAPIDVRAGWEFMAAVIPVPRQSTPFTTLSWQFRVSVTWLRGALLRFRTSASDLDRRTWGRADLALAADLGYWPELSVEDAAPLYVRHGPSGWWAAVREVAAAVRRRPDAGARGHRSRGSDSRSAAGSTPSDDWERFVREILPNSQIAIDLALLLAFPLLPLPPVETPGEWFAQLGERFTTYDENELRAIHPRIRIAATRLRFATASAEAEAEAATRLMAEFVALLGEPWPVRDLTGGQTVRVVHATYVENRASQVEVMGYLGRAIEFFGDQRFVDWMERTPAPERAWLSRALGVDRLTWCSCPLAGMPCRVGEPNRSTPTRSGPAPWLRCSCRRCCCRTG